MKTGYYFIKLSGEWQIMHYDLESNSFTLTGNDEVFKLYLLKETDEIGAKIEMPNESDFPF